MYFEKIKVRLKKVASSWQNSFRRIDWYTVSRVIQSGQNVRIYGSHVNDDAEVNARRAIEEAPEDTDIRKQHAEISVFL